MAEPNLDALNKAASALTQVLSQATSSAGGMVSAVGSAVSSVSSMLTGVLGPAGAAAGQALGQVVSQVGQFIDVTRQWVDAFAPGTIALFDQSLRNLQATLGVAFEPIFQVFNALAQRISGILLPVMEQLRPIVQQVSEQFANALLPIVQALVSSFQSFLPFLKMLADIAGVYAQELRALVSVVRLVSLAFEPFRMLLQVALAPTIQAFQIFGQALESMGEILDAVSSVFQVLFDTIRSALGGLNITDILKKLASATQDVIRNFYVLIGTIAKFFGANAFLANLIKSLEPKSGQVAAPRNASIGSVEALAREFATAAATASGTSQSEQEKTTADVVSELKNIQAGGESKFSQLITKLDKVITLLGGGADGALKQLGYDSKSEALADVTGVAGGGAFGLAMAVGRRLRKN